MDTHPNYPSPSKDQLWREREAESQMCWTARQMKPANDILNAFLARKDEMAALSRLYGAPAIDVACVFEALADWHGGILKQVGR